MIVAEVVTTTAGDAEELVVVDVGLPSGLRSPREMDAQMMLPRLHELVTTPVVIPTDADVTKVVVFGVPSGFNRPSWIEAETPDGFKSPALIDAQTNAWYVQDAVAVVIAVVSVGDAVAEVVVTAFRVPVEELIDVVVFGVPSELSRPNDTDADTPWLLRSPALNDKQTSEAYVHGAVVVVATVVTVGGAVIEVVEPAMVVELPPAPSERLTHKERQGASFGLQVLHAGAVVVIGAVVLLRVDEVKVELIADDVIT